MAWVLPVNLVVLCGCAGYLLEWWNAGRPKTRGFRMVAVVLAAILIEALGFAIWYAYGLVMLFLIFRGAES